MSANRRSVVRVKECFVIQRFADYQTKQKRKDVKEKAEASAKRCKKLICGRIQEGREGDENG